MTRKRPASDEDMTPVITLTNPSMQFINASPEVSDGAKVLLLNILGIPKIRGAKVHRVRREEILERYYALYGGRRLRTFRRYLKELKDVGLVAYDTSTKRPEIAVYVPPESSRRVLVIEEVVRFGRMRRRFFYEEESDMADTESTANRRYGAGYRGSMGRMMRIFDEHEGLPNTPTPRIRDPFAMLPGSISKKCISRQIASKSNLPRLLDAGAKSVPCLTEEAFFKKDINNKTSGDLGTNLSANFSPDVCVLAGNLPHPPKAPRPAAGFIRGTGSGSSAKKAGTGSASKKDSTTQLPSTIEAYQVLEAEAARRPRWTRSVSYDKARQAYAIAEAVDVPIAERGALALIGLWFVLYRAEFGTSYRPHRVLEQARAVYAELSKLLAEEDAPRLDGAMRFFLSNRKTAFKGIRCWRIDTFCKIIGDVLATQVQHRDVADRKGDKKNSYGAQRG
jgi:hypothetical protein